MKPPFTFCCPRDENRLEPAGPHSNGALACRTCSGLWITKRELDGRIDAETMQRLFHNTGGRMTTLRCPMDGGILWEFDVHGVQIDRCNHCAGLWFDAGELQTILSSARAPKQLLTSTKPLRKKQTPYIDSSPDYSWVLDLGTSVDFGDLLEGIVDLFTGW